MLRYIPHNRDDGDRKMETPRFRLATYFTSAEGFEQTIELTNSDAEEFAQDWSDTMLKLQEIGAKIRTTKNTYGGNGSSNGASSHAAASAAPAAPSGPVPPCEWCGKEIKGFDMKGKWYAPDYLVETRRKNYGAALCGVCAKKAKDKQGG